MHLTLNNPLWDYSCRSYQHPRIRELCLLLQDDEGADVNLLLCSGWAAAHSYRLDMPMLKARVQTLRRQCVLPLRALRRKLASTHTAEGRLRRQVLALEIKAEQVEIALLYANLAETTSIALTPLVSAPERHNNINLCYQNLLDTLAIPRHAQNSENKLLRELSSLLMILPIELETGGNNEQ